MKTILDARLSAVASCVAENAFLADVGTDHAYLPIALAEAGKIRGAVASDIRRGPLDRAEQNIRAAGLADRIDTMLTDGLRGIERYPVTDAVIAGMGGQMIASILDASPFVRERRTRLILQPMQNASELRAYLANGYHTEKEIQLVTDGKYYQIICTVWDGEIRTLSPVELLLGRYTIAHKRENEEVFTAFCRRHIELLQKKVRGMEIGGGNPAEERALIAAIEAELNTL